MNNIEFSITLQPIANQAKQDLPELSAILLTVIGALVSESPDVLVKIKRFCVSVSQEEIFKIERGQND